MNPSTHRIGFIGTGIMGKSLALHLLNAKYRVTVYNRSADKLVDLVAKGAVAVGSPAEVARCSDMLLVMVGYPSDVEQVLLGPQGALGEMKRGSLVCDLTTSRPKLAREVHAAAKQRSVMSLDAPVTGGDVGAREAKLMVMVGGDKDAFQLALPVLRLFGTPVHMGEAGAGQTAKMANQITIAGSMCEGLVYAHRAGLDLETYLQAIRTGGAASKSLDLYAPRILKGDMKPGFIVKHFVKDLHIALDEARDMGLALPGLALVSQLYTSLVGCQESELGTQALVRAISRLSAVQGAPW
jgi:3-hydroxyisobutyrate dehydrogenase